jgi:dolichol-phosphate mannosyltransferase
VTEVPIVFEDRTLGESKMTAGIVFEAVWQVPVLRLRALGGKLETRGQRDPAAAG